jgi:hypothetical protein
MKKRTECLLAILLTVLMCLVIPVSAFSADKLVVNNPTGSPVFVVEDNGRATTGAYYQAQGGSPGFWLDETGAGHKGAFFVLDNGVMQVQRRAQGFGAYEAQVMRFNINAPNNSLRIESDGDVGLGIAAIHPLHMASGAFVSSGGVWTNASSREYKTDIKQLTAEKAIDSLTRLNPVEFIYKTDKEERHVGFIAEDAPDLVATKDRKGMSSMDVVAVLTKVVQEQQKVVQEQRITIAELSRRLALVEKTVKTK